MTKTYSFSENKKNGEHHIFEAVLNSTLPCAESSKSICQKSENKDNDWIKTCLDEKQARLKAAELGRLVCATCVSHLYTTY